MDNLKKINDDNLLDATGTTLLSTSFKLPQASSNAEVAGNMNSDTSSMNIPEEYRDFSNLDDELQSVDDTSEQFLRCRNHLTPKNQKLDPEMNDHVEVIAKDISNGRSATIPVELVKEAADERLDRNVPSNPIGSVPGLQMNSPHFPSFEAKRSKDVNVKSKNFSELLHFWNSNRLRICFLVLIVVIVLFFPSPIFVRGIIVGAYLSVVISQFIHYMCNPSEEPIVHHWPEQLNAQEIVKKELLTTDKVVYTGWMNFLSSRRYDVNNYHVKLTQSVLVRLDRDILRFYFPKKGVKKRTIWNEKKIDPTYVSQEMYNIAGASVCIQPTDLASRRWWSRKYPICITFANGSVPALPDETQSDTGFIISQHEKPELSDDSSDNSDSEESETHSSSPQRISLSNSISDLPKTQIGTVLESANSPKQNTIYLFARSNREKEQWFHQLRKAADHYYVKSLLCESNLTLSDNTNHDKVENLDQKVMDRILYSNLQALFDKTMESVTKQKLQRSDLVSMDLGVQMWKPVDRVSADIAVDEANIAWANALVGRIFMDFSKDPYWLNRIKDKVERKMATIPLPHFIESLKLMSLELGENVPRINNVFEPTVNEWGLWVDMNIEYTGGIHCLIETKLNLMKLKTNAEQREENVRAYDDENIPESPESLSGDSDEDQQPNLPEKPKKSKGKKLLNMLDIVAQSKLFQNAIDNKYVKKMMQGVSDTPINLIVDVVYLKGTFVLNIPTPPSERMWYGFRCPPNVTLKCKPKVGETPLNLTHVMDWIEAKVCSLLEKFLVVPNLDDLIIPILSGGSPLLKDIYE